MRLTLTPFGATAVAALAATTLVACGPKHRLHEYDFRGRSVAVATIAPPRPEVVTDADLDIDPENPLGSLVRVGSELVREAEARRLQARMDSAAAAVDVSGRMGRRILESAARHLRAEPVDDGRAADYELEVRVRRYGIVAASWTSGAYFDFDGDVLLLDGETGRIIWETRVRARDPVRSSLFGTDERAIDNVITAVALAELSAREVQRAFESLADYAADAVLRKFTEDLDEARRRR